MPVLDRNGRRRTPVSSAIIDVELTACDDQGLPDFRALHFRKRKKHHLCVWAFDLLELNGRDLRDLPLEKRKRVDYQTTIERCCVTTSTS
jgi:ATP-dependent DNA ligase